MAKHAVVKIMNAFENVMARRKKKKKNKKKK